MRIPSSSHFCIHSFYLFLFIYLSIITIINFNVSIFNTKCSNIFNLIIAYPVIYDAMSCPESLDGEMDGIQNIIIIIILKM